MQIIFPCIIPHFVMLAVIFCCCSWSQCLLLTQFIRRDEQIKFMNLADESDQAVVGQCLDCAVFLRCISV